MEEFLRYVISHLVDHPDEMVLTQASTAHKVTFTISLNEGEIGKVIGRQGRTVEAIRNLVAAAAAKRGQKATVQIDG